MSALETAKDDLAGKVETNTTDISGLKTDVAGLKESNETISATTTETKNTVDILKQNVSGYDSQFESINSDITAINESIKDLGKNTGHEYDVSYEENVFTLYEDDVIKKQFTITGGSGPSDTTTVTIERITSSDAIFLAGNSAVIEYNFTSVDNTGDTTGNGTATALPTSSVVIGDTYKVITQVSVAADNSYTGAAVTAKVGDLVVAMSKDPKWIVVPSGDEIVTTVKYSTTTQNLTTSAKSGEITVGEAATKQVDSSIAAASTSTKLPTSKAVAAFVEGKGYKTTDQKVKNTLNTTAKAYVTGTTSATNLLPLIRTIMQDPLLLAVLLHQQLNYPHLEKLVTHLLMVLLILPYLRWDLMFLLKLQKLTILQKRKLEL